MKTGYSCTFVRFALNLLDQHFDTKFTQIIIVYIFNSENDNILSLRQDSVMNVD